MSGEVGEATRGAGHLKVFSNEIAAGEPEEDPDHQHQWLGVEDAVELEVGEREEADHRTELQPGAHGVRTFLLARDPFAVRQAVTVGIDGDATIGSGALGSGPSGESLPMETVSLLPLKGPEQRAARRPGFVQKRIGM